MCPLHKGSKIHSRTILGRQRSVFSAPTGVVECTECIVRVAGEACEDQEQHGVAIEQSLPLLQQEGEVFKVGEGIHGEQRKEKTLNKTYKQNGGETCSSTA